MEFTKIKNFEELIMKKRKNYIQYLQNCPTDVEFGIARILARKLGRDWSIAKSKGCPRTLAVFSSSEIIIWHIYKFIRNVRERIVEFLDNLKIWSVVESMPQSARIVKLETYHGAFRIWRIIRDSRL